MEWNDAEMRDGGGAQHRQQIFLSHLRCRLPPVAAVDGFQNGGWCLPCARQSAVMRTLQRKLQVAHGTQGSRCSSWQKKARWRQLTTFTSVPIPSLFFSPPTLSVSSQLATPSSILNRRTNPFVDNNSRWHVNSTPSILAGAGSIARINKAPRISRRRLATHAPRGTPRSRARRRR